MHLSWFLDAPRNPAASGVTGFCVSFNLKKGPISSCSRKVSQVTSDGSLKRTFRDPCSNDKEREPEGKAWMTLGNTYMIRNHERRCKVSKSILEPEE